MTVLKLQLNVIKSCQHLERIFKKKIYSKGCLLDMSEIMYPHRHAHRAH